MVVDVWGKWGTAQWIMFVSPAASAYSNIALLELRNESLTSLF